MWGQWERSKELGVPAEWQEASRKNQKTHRDTLLCLPAQSPCKAVISHTGKGLNFFSSQDLQPAKEERAAWGVTRTTEETWVRHCLLSQSLTWEGKYSASWNIIRHEFSPAGSEGRAPCTLMGQVAKLALQPAEPGPGHKKYMCVALQGRCAMACKIPELTALTKPNLLDSMTGKGPEVWGRWCHTHSTGQGGRCYSVKQRETVYVTKKEKCQNVKSLFWHEGERRAFVNF